MSKTAVTVFLCNGKDCSRAWHRFCDGSPGKWLKRQVETAGLPCKLHIVKTECMDRCDDAACLCFVHDRSACFESGVRCGQDGDQLLAVLRACCERSRLPV